MNPITHVSWQTFTLSTQIQHKSKHVYLPWLPNYKNFEASPMPACKSNHLCGTWWDPRVQTRPRTDEPGSEIMAPCHALARRSTGCSSKKAVRTSPSKSMSRRHYFRSRSSSAQEEKKGSWHSRYRFASCSTGSHSLLSGCKGFARRAQTPRTRKAAESHAKEDRKAHQLEAKAQRSRIIVSKPE